MLRLAALASILAIPAAAHADLDDPFTVGLQATGVRRSPEAMRESSADAAFGARLKFFRGFGVDTTFTLGAVDAVDPVMARTVKELFPSPNVRVLGIFEPLTNRWFSPYLLGGAGWATSSTLSVSTLLAGLGVQIGMGPHVAVALDGLVLLPWPDNATSFVRRSETLRATGQKMPRIRLGDLLNINRHEIQVAIRYYL